MIDTYKPVVVLLALLVLEAKGISSILPGFPPPTVTGVLVKNFDILSIGTLQDDITAIMTEK